MVSRVVKFHSLAKVFEKGIEQTLRDLNVAIYFDDFIVFSEDQEEHDKSLFKLFKRARKYSVELNSNKMQLNCDAVKYLGHIVSTEGLKLTQSTSH